MTFSIFQLSELGLCEFWPVLQRAGPHAVSKDFGHKMRLCVGSHSPRSSLTLWSSVVLSRDSQRVESISLQMGLQ